MREQDGPFGWRYWKVTLSVGAGLGYLTGGGLGMLIGAGVFAACAGLTVSLVAAWKRHPKTKGES